MGLDWEGLQLIGLQKRINTARTAELKVESNILRGQSRKTCFNLMLEHARSRKNSSGCIEKKITLGLTGE